MKRAAGTWITGLGLAVLLAGCTSTGTDSVPAPTSSRTTAPTPAASVPTSAASPTPDSAIPVSTSPASQATKVSAARTDPGAPKGQCRDAALTVEVKEAGGGLGSRQDSIVFRNTGSASCRLSGAPGISVVGDGNGTQLGKPAGRYTGSSRVTTLQPGASVTAVLTRNYVDGKTTTFRTATGLVACKPKHGDGYRVYPPHSFKAVFVKHDVWACTSDFVWMHIAPVVAGR